MNLILNTPLGLRYALLAVIGAWIGGQINRAIYRLAYSPREISPWSAPPAGAEPRTWRDRLPIVGWLALRRESAEHGRGFWIRPLLIEVACTLGFPWLYYWEMSGELLPPIPGALAVAGPAMLHGQFLSHLVLMCLMLAATFIDFDEKTIPDAITVPGTLIALLLAALWPAANLPVSQRTANVVTIEPLLLTTPHAWSEWLSGHNGLLLGLACYLAWLAALLNYTWTLRRGLKKAIVYALVSMTRVKYQLSLTALAAVIGSAAIGICWVVGGMAWQGLLTALVGLAGGGGLVWLVRIVASYGAGREAMGFGDVTLMAMIGAFLGWQPAIIIFFMAPALGSLIAVVQALITGHTEIAFGPYLCAAAAVMIVFWSPIWHGWAEQQLFQLGWFIPLIVFACIALMGVMLLILRIIKEVVFGIR